MPFIEKRMFVTFCFCENEYLPNIFSKAGEEGISEFIVVLAWPLFWQS